MFWKSSNWEWHIFSKTKESAWLEFSWEGHVYIRNLLLSTGKLPLVDVFVHHWKRYAFVRDHCVKSKTTVALNAIRVHKVSLPQGYFNWNIWNNVIDDVIIEIARLKFGMLTRQSYLNVKKCQVRKWVFGSDNLCSLCRRTMFEKQQNTITDRIVTYYYYACGQNGVCTWNT